MKRDKLNLILDHFDQISVIVIGDLMLDRFIYGNATRLSPESPVPLIDVATEVFRLGGAANAVNNIRVLGGKVIAVGVIGDDWFGKRLTGLLKEDGIDTTGIIECGERRTTVKTRVIAGQQQLLRFDRETREPIKKEYIYAILDFLKNKIASADVVLISDYNKGVVTRDLFKGLLSLAEKFDKPILVYPKVEQSLDYKGINTFITTIGNAISVTGIKQINETSLRNIGQWLLTHLECDHVIITHEKGGLSCFDRKGTVTHIPPTTTEFMNITGTIDTVACITALSLPSCISDMIESAILANIGADIAGIKKETSTVTRDEINSKIKDI